MRIEKRKAAKPPPPYPKPPSYEQHLQHKDGAAGNKAEPRRYRNNPYAPGKDIVQRRPSNNSERMGNTQTGGNRHHAIAMGGFNETGAQQTFRRIGEDRRSGTERSNADGRGDHGAEKGSHYPDKAQVFTQSG
jgi:hypothetical protein